MRNFFEGAATVAAGVLFAAAVVLGGFQLNKPASSLSIDLEQYLCQLKGAMIECTRR